jgi:hypothetical protein
LDCGGNIHRIFIGPVALVRSVVGAKTMDVNRILRIVGNVLLLGLPVSMGIGAVSAFSVPPQYSSSCEMEVRVDEATWQEAFGAVSRPWSPAVRIWMSGASDGREHAGEPATWCLGVSAKDPQISADAANAIAVALQEKFGGSALAAVQRHGPTSAEAQTETPMVQPKVKIVEKAEPAAKPDRHVAASMIVLGIPGLSLSLLGLVLRVVARFWRRPVAKLYVV